MGQPTSRDDPRTSSLTEAQRRAGLPLAQAVDIEPDLPRGGGRAGAGELGAFPRLAADAVPALPAVQGDGALEVHAAARVAEHEGQGAAGAGGVEGGLLDHDGGGLLRLLAPGLARRPGEGDRLAAEPGGAAGHQGEEEV